jgi:hypothetical protein
MDVQIERLGLVDNVYYQIGRWGTRMPLAPVPEHCVSVDGGPIRFVIEARQLTDAIAAEHQAQYPDSPPVEHDGAFDDFGASLHVCGAADGLEHLRFDCFDNDPHYHYIHQADQRHLLVRMDDIAEPETISWTVTRLRERLPEMLEYADAVGLAANTRSNLPSVIAAVDRVEELLREADRKATLQHEKASVGNRIES